MRFGRFLLLVVGVILGVLFVLWWVYYRNNPLICSRNAQGRSMRVSTDWIEIG